MRPAAILLLCAMMSAPARAAFVRSLLDRTDTEPLFDSEYFADLRSFAPPRAWEDAWAGSQGGYRVNAASLDCCDLFMDQGLVFGRRLNESLEFRFRFTDLSDKDRQEQHHWLELERALGAGWSVELFGEPTFRKEDADIGLGLRWRRGGWQARARRTFVDFNFNGRGSTTQRYSVQPATDEVFLQAPLPNGRAWASAELDEPTRLEISDESRSFGYRRARFSAGAGLHAGLAPRVEYGYEDQRKTNRFAGPAFGPSEEAGRRVHTVSASARVKTGERGELEPGLAFLSRAARLERLDSPGAGAAYRRWELQPWVRWRRGLSALVVGELAGFFSFGESQARDILQAKLGAGADFVFSPASRIGLYGTFDADEPGQLWDGGNVRAMFLF